MTPEKQLALEKQLDLIYELKEKADQATEAGDFEKASVFAFQVGIAEAHLKVIASQSEKRFPSGGH